LTISKRMQKQPAAAPAAKKSDEPCGQHARVAAWEVRNKWKGNVAPLKCSECKQPIDIPSGIGGFIPE
jgi:hypothetical protein